MHTYKVNEYYGRCVKINIITVNDYNYFEAIINALLINTIISKNIINIFNFQSIIFIFITCKKNERDILNLTT